VQRPGCEAQQHCERPEEENSLRCSERPQQWIAFQQLGPSRCFASKIGLVLYSQIQETPHLREQPQPSSEALPLMPRVIPRE
jgi:hypothetical protein